MASGIYEFLLLSVIYFHLVDGDVIHIMLNHESCFKVNDASKNYNNSERLIKIEARISRRIYITYVLLIG